MIVEKKSQLLHESELGALSFAFDYLESRTGNRSPRATGKLCSCGMVCALCTATQGVWCVGWGCRNKHPAMAGQASGRSRGLRLFFWFSATEGRVRQAHRGGKQGGTQRENAPDEPQTARHRSLFLPFPMHSMPACAWQANPLGKPYPCLYLLWLLVNCDTGVV